MSGVKGRVGAGSRRRPSPAAKDRRVVVELEELRARLEEAEATLGAIRSGQVDALVVSGPEGEQVFTLQGAETPYRVMVEQMREGALSIGEDGTVLYCNRCFAEMVGEPLDRVLGSALGRFVRPEGARDLARLLREARGGGVRREVTFRAADGREVETQVSATAPPADEARRVCMIVTDLTDHKRNLSLLAKRTDELARSHEALRLAERLASVGTLATGLGHDMGNMLLPLRMRLDALESKSVGGGMREDIDAIRKCAEHLQRLTNGLRLLTLDPNTEGREEALNLTEWWPDAELVMRNSLPAHVALVADLPAGLPPVRLAPHALTQALFNLVQNAGDAMRGQPSGRVRLAACAAAPVTADAGGPGPSGADPSGAGMVRIVVSDDGPGMTEEVRRRCLEPFFTTRTRRLSTGLGLSLVHGIVQRAGGSIRVESEPGSGTTFVLEFPAVRPPDEEETRRRPAAAVTVADARLRSFACSLLRSMGYEVDERAPSDATIGAPDGDASLWIAESCPAVLRAAAKFTAKDAGKRVILIGANGGGRRSSRIIRVENAAEPSAVRRAIHEATKAWVEEIGG